MPVLAAVLMVGCGPRDSREPARQRVASARAAPPAPRRDAPRIDPLVLCRARVRCYGAVVKTVNPTVTISFRTLTDMLKVQLADMDPKRKAQAAAMLKVTTARWAKLSSALKSLPKPGPTKSLAACQSAKRSLREAMSLLRREWAQLVRQAVLLVAEQLKDNDPDMRRLARAAINDLEKDMRRAKDKLIGLAECKGVTREP
jgi:hypothetical protein